MGSFSNARSLKKQPFAIYYQRLEHAVWPYIELARINGLVGVWLTFWPCCWGSMMAAYALQLPLTSITRTIPLLWLGCALLHSAACTINDIFDREMDKLVERTKNRPIARGAVSVLNASIFFLAQVAAYLALLSWAPPLCAFLGILNLPMQIAYPLFKRFTHWPSLFLGMTFSWGSLCGWSAMTGSLDWKVVGPLYLGGVCWAFGYDIIYGYQDRRDDPKAGVKSTAILLGANPRPFLYTLAAAFMVFLTLAGIQNSHGLLYYIFTVGFAGAHVYWQVSTLDVTNPADCWAKFYTNSWIGWPMWVGGLLGDYICRVGL
ncbi:4-hydroxybenzoate polyprenyltransferase [Ceratobasidium theobromae]|uniref:4-hydroxybenzoate polyprenyltransferase, mitochondrial n=1 Tax=Ceratobasidium theobromae TaxID=1582974 RepID=A0A5N5QT86_9AGAM|nr:4-hydroxybenzoate polyprenyltransferase [Ceratobasidium theobromae]